jgi:hypothetical protein
MTDLTKAQPLVDQVAEGSPRNRLQQLTGLFIEHRYYSLAADLTERTGFVSQPRNPARADRHGTRNRGCPRRHRTHASPMRPVSRVRTRRLHGTGRGYLNHAMDIAAAVARDADM